MKKRQPKLAAFLIHLLQTCKPDSVFSFNKFRRRLSFIWLLHYCNNLAAYPSRYFAKYKNANEQFTLPVKTNRDIRGIAVHKVYPPILLPKRDVSSCLTFSPLSRPRPGWLFSVALSSRFFDKLRNGTGC